MQSDDLFDANYCSHDHIDMQFFFFNESIELFIVMYCLSCKHYANVRKFIKTKFKRIEREDI